MTRLCFLYACRTRIHTSTHALTHSHIHTYIFLSPAPFQLAAGIAGEEPLPKKALKSFRLIAF